MTNPIGYTISENGNRTRISNTKGLTNAKAAPKAHHPTINTQRTCLLFVKANHK